MSNTVRSSRNVKKPQRIIKLAKDLHSSSTAPKYEVFLLDGLLSALINKSDRTLTSEKPCSLIQDKASLIAMVSAVCGSKGQLMKELKAPIKELSSPRMIAPTPTRRTFSNTTASTEHVMPLILDSATGAFDPKQCDGVEAKASLVQASMIPTVSSLLSQLAMFLAFHSAQIPAATQSISLQPLLQKLKSAQCSSESKQWPWLLTTLTPSTRQYLLDRACHEDMSNTLLSRTTATTQRI
ncbi:unnamed protein product [Cuscuta campestris]|uniref:Uncharacterized protein n=1 Tax=Cuscuta campestris TaxID=132261 RepID=A0A484KCJ7_9ASTE|nr:unnamed protein product [Cuscuta campestris]